VVRKKLKPPDYQIMGLNSPRCCRIWQCPRDQDRSDQLKKSPIPPFGEMEPILVV